MNERLRGTRADAAPDRQTGRLLDEWLQNEAPKHEPPLLVPIALARIALTRRRPAWLIRDWWLWRSGRGERGFQRMNPAVRLIVVTALVASGVGLFMVAGGSDPGTHPAGQPAALDPSEVIAAVSGTTGGFTDTSADPLVFGDTAIEMRNVRLEGPLTLSDPRLSGHFWSVHNVDQFFDDLGEAGVGTVGIDNDEGSWTGTFRGFEMPGVQDGYAWYYNLLLTGSGAYDGLSAMLQFDPQEAFWAIEGIIFPGELPEYPDMD